MMRMKEYPPQAQSNICTPYANMAGEQKNSAEQDGVV